MEEYIDEVHTITDGDFMLEANALKDKFCLCFQLINKDRRPVDLFCEVLEEEEISAEPGLFMEKINTLYNENELYIDAIEKAGTTDAVTTILDLIDSVSKTKVRKKQ